MLTRRFLLVVPVICAFGALVPSASAQGVGEEQGVTAAGGKHGLVLRFGPKAAALYRSEIAGRRVQVGCGRVAPNSGGYVSDGEFSTVVRAPRRRGTLRTLTRGPADYCFVRGRPRRGDGYVAIAPVSERGRIFLDEARAVGMLFMPLFLAEGRLGETPAAEDLVRLGKGFVVALDGPDGTPPSGKVGYWTDGTRIALVTLSERGRRLFFERDGEVVRTNVLPYLTAD